MAFDELHRGDPYGLRPIKSPNKQKELYTVRTKDLNPCIIYKTSKIEKESHGINFISKEHNKEIFIPYTNIKSITKDK